VEVTEARCGLTEAAVLWSIEEIAPADVIRLACDALVAGLDTQALRERAGLSFSATLFEVEDLLVVALEELGIPFYERGGRAGHLAAMRVYAARCISGQIAPRELVEQLLFAEVINHTWLPGNVYFLSELDDPSRSLWFDQWGREDDRAVVEACRRLLDGQLDR
jgi:hypothetical protein